MNQLKDQRAKLKIDKRLTRLQLGNLGDYKSVGGGIYELRIDEGQGYGIYFGRTGNKIIVLLCAGNKSTQTQDIKRAELYWHYYKKEKNNAY